MNCDEKILCMHFVPELALVLTWKEKEKGMDLTEKEVLETLGKAVAIMVSIEDKIKLDQARGYRDLDPDNIWQEWCEYKASL